MNKNIEKITLMLPIGYGAGTIIFDCDGGAYRAKSCGVPPVYELEDITEQEAVKEELNGAKVLRAKV